MTTKKTNNTNESTNTNNKTTIKQAIDNSKVEWDIVSVDRLEVGTSGTNATLLIKYTSQRRDGASNPVSRAELYKFVNAEQASGILDYLRSWAIVSPTDCIKQLSLMSDKILHTWANIPSDRAEQVQERAVLHYVPAPRNA